MTHSNTGCKKAVKAGKADKPDPCAFDWPPPALIAGDFLAWLQAVLSVQGLLARTVTQLSTAIGCAFIKAIQSGPDKSAPSRLYSHEEWQNEPHLRLARLVHDAVFAQLDDLLCLTPNLERPLRRRLAFWLKHLRSAFCPAHNLWLSPEVREKAAETLGASFQNGLNLLKADLKRSRYRLRMARQPENAFELGADLASTPGETLGGNALFDLTVHECPEPKAELPPLLIVPPCINRYYVLDLRPENSFVRWCLEQGRKVYMMEWRSASDETSDCRFEDYISHGIETAAGMVLERETARGFDMLGYCIGGTMAAIHAGWRHGRGLSGLRRLTLLTALLDFDEPGELGIFISPEQLDRLESHLKRVKLMKGELLARAFELLQPDELMWGMALRRYGLGLENRPHDLLFWSEDNPDLPGAMLMDYLRQCYFQNRLVSPGAFKVQGWGFEMASLTCPLFCVATRADHIAPWKSVFSGAAHIPGIDRFILAEGGHIGGIVNPPSRKRLAFLHGAVDRAQGHDEWLRSASREQGSWWPFWHEWSQS